MNHRVTSPSAVELSAPEYDVYNVTMLRDELQELHGAACVIDFHRVRYFDSTALGVLVSTFKRLRASDSCSTITLINVSSAVRRIFDLTHLSELFRIE